MKEQNSGFVALISAIVITLVLLSTATALAVKGFLDRSNILDGNAKETSAGLASACVESARIKVARDGSRYAGGETLNVNGEECTVTSVTHSGGESTICAEGVYRRATTSYRVVVKTSDASIISWREITSAANCA